MTAMAAPFAMQDDEAPGAKSGPADHPEDAFLPARDAQALGKREGDRPLSFVRNLRGAKHGVARALRSPKVAFEKSHRGQTNQVFVQGLWRKLMAGAGAGVHRPLCVRSDDDQATAGGRTLLQRRSLEPDSERCHVMRENVA